MKRLLPLLLLPLLAFLATPAFAQAVTACPELTQLQRWVGFLQGVNYLMVVAVVLGVICGSILIFKFASWIFEIFKLIPREVYEVLGYAGAVALIASGHWQPPLWEQWSSLGGCLLFGGMMLVTAAFHNIEPRPVRFFGILTVLWGAVAIFYMNTYVGFISVAALMAALGFSAAVLPFGYLIGFRDEDGLGRATSTAFLVLIVYVFARVVGGDLDYFKVFEQGALWIGAFVGYLGLLIASSRWFWGKRTNYVLMQVITIVMGLGAVFIGTTFNIPQLAGVGGTFFTLYLIEKPFEIPTHSVTAWAIRGMIVAVGCWYAYFWAMSHRDVIEPYLLF